MPLIRRGDNDRPRRGHRVRWAVLGAAMLAALCLPAVSAELAPGASCEETEVEIGIVVAKGCFNKAKDDRGDEYWQSADEPLTINGFTVTTGRQHMRFYTGRNSDGTDQGPKRVTSNGRAIWLTSKFVEGASPKEITWQVSPAVDFNPPNKGSMPLTDAVLTGVPQIFSVLPPLHTKGLVELTEGGGHFSIHVGLASILQFTEKSGEIAFGFEVEEDGKVEFEGVEGEAEGIPIAGLLEIHDLAMELTMHPEFSLDASAGVTLKLPERFEGKGLEASFGVNSQGPTKFGLAGTGLNLQLGTSGIYLQKAGLTLLLQPVGFGGQAGFSAGPKVNVFGHQLAALEVEGNVDFRSPDEKAKKHGFVESRAGMKVFNIPIAGAHFLYTFGVGTEFDGSIGVGVPALRNDPSQPLYIGGDFKGWTTAAHFNLEGESRLRAFGWDLAGSKSVISDVGLAACVQVGLWVGAGVRWRDGHVDALGGFSCDVGGFRSRRAAAAGLAESARAEAPLHLGDDVAVVSVVGEDDPPMVELVHEDGRRFQTPPESDADGMMEHEHGVAIAEHDGGDSVHFLPEEADGDWTLRSLDGSPVDVEAVKVAEELPDHNVKARLRGKGLRRTLVWSARKIPHQSLVFTEVLPDGSEHGLFRTNRPQGNRKVRLAHGGRSYGRRKLEVDVRQRFDTPRDELIADRYRVKRPKPPAKPRHVRAVRLLHDVLVSWRPVKGASGYRIVTKDPSGLRRVRTVGPRARRIRLDSVATLRRLEIRVFAANRDGVEGKPGRTALDTHRLVSGPRQALRNLLRDARRHSRRNRVVTYPECPMDGSCTFTLRAVRGKRVIGRDVVRLGPDMTDRLAFRAKGGLKGAKLRAELIYKGRTLTRVGCTWQFYKGQCP